MTKFNEAWDECINAVTNSTIISDGAAREIAATFHSGEESITFLFSDTGEITNVDALMEDFTNNFQDIQLLDTGPFDQERLNDNFALWSLVQYVSRKGERGPQKNWEKNPVREKDF